MSDEIRVRRLTPDDWETWRDVRLTALAEAPYAFGSTLAREREFDEARWRSRSSAGVVAVADAGSDVLGTMGIYLPPTGLPMLVGAWVDPRARGRGVGDALVAEVLDWAREEGWEQVELRVVETNEPARRLFLRNGFVPTGEREPLESDPTVDTEFMVRKLS